MISKQRITDLIEQKLEGTDAFLVHLSISGSNSIRVIIDADSGVSIEKCIALSRHIEHNLNREEEDFALEVTSAGVGEPLVLERQYVKNIGRNLKIVLSDDKIVKGELVTVEQDFLTLKRNLTKKEEKAGVEPLYNIDFKDIKESKVEISFK